ncbi:zinc finger CCCH domain-containing protein 13 isoform X3 [Nematostella vectensis]|uniref:zinc finger CCCH domain-containing protein 13 isoform X3 n=1 Tax=Nematostella vectensis TaxID=45351 RepID=UPI0020772F30|nr:zinc finger CCCH domain-containing protein 13 isoform X3 [Nematostella vectensis]
MVNTEQNLSRRSSRSEHMRIMSKLQEKPPESRTNGGPPYNARGTRPPDKRDTRVSQPPDTRDPRGSRPTDTRDARGSRPPDKRDTQGAQLPDKRDTRVSTRPPDTRDTRVSRAQETRSTQDSRGGSRRSASRDTRDQELDARGRSQNARTRSMRNSGPPERRDDLSRDNRREAPRDNRREVSRDNRRDASRDNKPDVPRERRDTLRDERRDMSRDKRREASRDERRDIPRDERRDIPRDERRDAPREGRRDPPRDDRRDAFLDDRREGRSTQEFSRDNRLRQRSLRARSVDRPRVTRARSEGGRRSRSLGDVRLRNRARSVDRVYDLWDRRYSMKRDPYPQDDMRERLYGGTRDIHLARDPPRHEPRDSMPPWEGPRGHSTRDKARDIPPHWSDQYSIQARDDLYNRLQARDDPYIKQPGRDDPYNKPSARDDLYDRPPLRDDPYHRPPLRDDPHSRPPLRDDPHSRPPLRDDPYSRPPLRDDPYNKPSARDDLYDRPPLRDDPYHRPPLRDDPHSRPPLRDDPYSRPPLRDDFYSRPPLLDDQPPLRDDPYNRPPLRDDPFGRPPLRDDPLSRPPLRDDPHSRLPLRDKPYNRDPLQNDQYGRPPLRDDPYSRPSLRDDPLSRPPLHNDPFDRTPLRDDLLSRPTLGGDLYDRPPLRNDPYSRNEAGDDHGEYGPVYQQAERRDMYGRYVPREIPARVEQHEFDALHREIRAKSEEIKLQRESVNRDIRKGIYQPISNKEAKVREELMKCNGTHRDILYDERDAGQHHYEEIPPRMSHNSDLSRDPYEDVHDPRYLPKPFEMSQGRNEDNIIRREPRPRPHSIQITHRQHSSTTDSFLDTQRNMRGHTGNPPQDMRRHTVDGNGWGALPDTYLMSIGMPTSQPPPAGKAMNIQTIDPLEIQTRAPEDELRDSYVKYFGKPEDSPHSPYLRSLNSVGDTDKNGWRYPDKNTLRDVDNVRQSRDNKDGSRNADNRLRDEKLLNDSWEASESMYRVRSFDFSHQEKRAAQPRSRSLDLHSAPPKEEIRERDTRGKPVTAVAPTRARVMHVESTTPRRDDRSRYSYDPYDDRNDRYNGYSSDHYSRHDRSDYYDRQDRRDHYNRQGRGDHYDRSGHHGRADRRDHYDRRDQNDRHDRKYDEEREDYV